jgi:hypothetical protein
MSTRYAKIQKAKGDLYFTVGGREFTTRSFGRTRMLCEILERGDGCVSSFYGYWRGQRRLGHDLLASAGAARRRAMAAPDDFQKQHFKTRAREGIEASKFMRLAMQPALPARVAGFYDNASPALARELRAA